MITGTAINGDQRQLKAGTFEAVAGVRERDGYLEVAFRGPAPRTLPAAIMLDGKAFNAVERVVEGVSVGFVVLKAVPA